MKCFITILILFQLWGCASSQNPIPTLQSSSTLAPASLVMKMAVEEENACEDPKHDAQTMTMTEAIADTLSYPYTLTILIARIAAYMSVGVVMAAMGKDPKQTNQTINEWLPLNWSSPNPDKVDYKKVKLVEGCLNKQKAL